MARKKSAQMSLNKIDGFAYALRRAPDKLKERLQSAMDAWAAAAQGDYDSATGYGGGFSRMSGKSYHLVEPRKKGAGIYAAVGHASYIARFLEAGTRAHAIAHRQGRGYAVAQVRGIKGSKALSKVWNGRLREIPAIIEGAVKEIILKGG